MMQVDGAPSLFDAVVFAGGGCRCFWQAGFWSTAAPALDLRPKLVLGVSAGSAIACASLVGDGERVVASFERRTAVNAQNLYPRNLLGGDPVFPHESIYRGTLLDHLDESVLERLREGPELRVLIARPPPWLGARSGLAVGVLAAVLNDRHRRVHAIWGWRFGFRPEVASVRDCRRADELANLILHSSCTPPLLPLYRRGRRIALDGGLLDNAPADLVGESRSTLVLLTRRFREEKIPTRPGRLYIQPSRDVPVAKWDYTSPRLIRETFDLGRRDGEVFAASMRADPTRRRPLQVVPDGARETLEVRVS